MELKEEKMEERSASKGHEIELLVEAEALEKQRKKAEVTLMRIGTKFTIYCDEGAYLQGDNTAPPPLAYLSSSVAFWLLTHVSLYATMLKLKIQKVKAKVKTKFWGEGSLVAETIGARCTGVETVLEIESDDDPAQIAKLARESEAGCYVIQALRSPTPVSYQVTLNGQPLDPRRAQ